MNSNIGEPPWDYNFLINLDEKEYPKYLAKIFNYRTGEKLPLRFDFNQQAWIIDKKRCKTFNQKIQWIKLNFRRVVSPNDISGVRTRSNKKSAETEKGVNGILDTFVSGSKDFNEENSGYGVTDLMRKCTDKVAVRDYVRERIGEEYLKPVLQIIPHKGQQSEQVIARNNSILGDEAIQPIVNENFNQLDCHADTKMSLSARNDGKINDVSTYFGQIDFNKLPNAFVIKTNHGSKWQYIIKDKEQFLNTPQLFVAVKRNITGWLEQEYFPWNGFEMQYKGIEPKILIEPLLQQNINENSESIQIYCFNGQPKYIEHLYDSKRNQITIYDDNLRITEDIFESSENKINKEADEIIKRTFDLSKQLATDFYFVRVDWMLYKNRPYFEEMTFTPYSGFWHFKNKKKHMRFGKLLNL